MPSISFSDTELDRIFSEESSEDKAICESYRTKLDGISSDIKKLEEYIRSCGIKIPFTFYVEKPKGLEPNTCYILWDKADNGDFRLLSEEGFYEESFGYNEPSFKVLERKPLIETRCEVRLALAPYLATFFKSLAKRLKVEKQEKKQLCSDDFSEIIPF